MFPRTVETAFARFQDSGDTRAMAIVFDRTAPELSRLARHLARDAAEADDLLQATFLTAIEKSGQHQRGKPVLPWLCGVLANHARMQRRRNRRAPDRDRLPADVVHDVHDEVEGNELRAQVRDAIARLPEVYRPVLRLWLEHGLEAREIAATLERPEGTVRAQVTRGLDQLRRALPATVAGAAAVALGAGRGLAAIRREVLGACTGTSTGIASTFAFAGLLMLHHKLLVGGVAAAIALLLFWSWPPPEVAPRSGDEVAAVAAQPADAAPRSDAAAAPVAGPGELEREQVAADPADDAATPPPPTTTSLLVRVVDAETGAPLVGYHVAIGGEDATQAFGRSLRFVATDARGEVSFDELTAGARMVFVDRALAPTMTNVRVGRRNRHLVQLVANATITGTVTDEAGRPVPGAEVFAVGNWVQPIPLTTADRHGRFAVAHANDPRLLARAAGYQPSLARTVLTRGAAAAEVTLSLGAGGHRITGSVVDVDGRPLLATVAILPKDATGVHPWTADRPVRVALCVTTDADGRFATDEARAGPHVLLAVPRDQDLSPIVADVDTTDHDAHAALQASAPTVLEGRLIGRDVPTHDLRVVAFTEEPTAQVGYLLNLVGLRSTSTATDGTYRLAGLPAGTVVVRALRGLEPVAEARLRIAAGRTHDWSPDLAPPRTLAVHATVADGALPNGLFVLVHGAGDGAMPAMAPLDARGAAEVVVPRGGPLQVTLAVRDGPRTLLLARRADVGPAERSVQFDLHADQLPIGVVRGRLVDAQRAPRAGERVGVLRTDRPELTVDVAATTGPDGAFAIGPLPAGAFALTLGAPPDAVVLGELVVTAAGDAEVGDVVAPR